MYMKYLYRFMTLLETISIFNLYLNAKIFLCDHLYSVYIGLTHLHCNIISQNGCVSMLYQLIYGGKTALIVR